MPIELLLPIAIFVALLVAFLVLLRRVSLVMGETRELISFRRSVTDLAGRIDATLADITAKVDAVRRRQTEAAMISSDIDLALEALLAYGAEARALQGPGVTATARASFVAEIDRAERALQMVEHGCAVLSTAGGHHRLTEAETAIKRGYLNVVHAREALARHASDIAAARSGDETRWRSRRPRPSGRGRPGDE